MAKRRGKRKVCKGKYGKARMACLRRRRKSRR